MSVISPASSDSSCLLDTVCTWSRASGARAALEAALGGLVGTGLIPAWAALYANRQVVDALMPRLKAAGAWTRWPLMVLITPGDIEQGGFQAWSPAMGTPLCDDGRVVGLSWLDNAGRCRASLCGLTPAAGLAPEAATEAVFARAADLLGTVGLGWADVYRTWFYNDRILDWYGDFNRVRTAAYRRARVDFHRAPASTGIGLANGDGAALSFGVLAAAPHIEPGPVVSPLQNAAMNYGSLFSRATEETVGDTRRLWVSGTADIDADGNTCHLGDFTAQTIRTYEIVGAILQSRGMEWRDVRRATAYVREPADVARHAALVATGAIPALAAVAIPATVCRDNLLFELELDAIL